MKKIKPKVKEKKNEEDNFDFIKTNKDNIKNILKTPNTILPIINDLVNRTNKIVIHTYQFIKLYMNIIVIYQLQINNLFRMFLKF